jgi:hypothetical protein
MLKSVVTKVMVVMMGVTVTLSPGQAAAGVKAINASFWAKTGEPTANATKTTSNPIEIIL